jgi:hypothetical protein
MGSDLAYGRYPYRPRSQPALAAEDNLNPERAEEGLAQRSRPASARGLFDPTVKAMPIDPTVKAMPMLSSRRESARNPGGRRARAALGPAVAAPHSIITGKAFFAGWHPPRGLQILSYRRTAVCGFNDKSRSTSREFLVIKTHRLSDASKKSKQSFRNRRRSCFGMPWVRDRIPAINDASSQTS